MRELITVHFLMQWLSVAFAVGVADVCWAKYSQEIAAKVPGKAAFWSMMIILLGAYSTVEYVGNHWLLSAALVGAFAGTYFGVLHSKRSG